MNNFMIALVYVIARLKEPSTYAGLAGLLVANHIGNANELATAITSILVGAASLAAIFLQEKK